jgi:hypothetical protein
MAGREGTEEGKNHRSTFDVTLRSPTRTDTDNSLTTPTEDRSAGRTPREFNCGGIGRVQIPRR